MINTEQEMVVSENNTPTVDWLTRRLEDAQILIGQGLNHDEAIDRLVSSSSCTPELANHLDFMARFLISLNH